MFTHRGRIDCAPETSLSAMLLIDESWDSRDETPQTGRTANARTILALAEGIRLRRQDLIRSVGQ